jgi:hypothetical protein
MSDRKPSEREAFMAITIKGASLPNIPWEPKPAGLKNQVLWRFSVNPVIGWNPTLSTARVYNSAVVPFGDGFAGVFRADHKHGKALLHAGFFESPDLVHWSRHLLGHRLRPSRRDRGPPQGQLRAEPGRR